MDYSAIVSKLRQRCAASTMTGLARELGISKQYLNDVLKERREAGPKILSAMGIRRIVTYRRAPTNGNGN